MTSIQYETEFDIFYHIIMLVQNYSFKKKSHPTKSQLPACTIYESISELYYILLIYLSLNKFYPVLIVITLSLEI